MSLNWNNVKPACCAKWLVLPTVYSDTLSYGEQLDKFCYQLNQLIENNNILPDFIAEMIKEYINSGAIGEVVRDILSDYILNVKYPPKGITPAVGDGSADDTAAIQGCIDYAAENGGVVYFPYGSYLTQPLTMKDGVSLFGFDRYSTKIVLKAGATKPLIGGAAADLSIANLTLDGNSGIQVNDVNVVTVMGTNVLFTNLIIKDGYTLVNYTGTGGHLQISDVVFGNAVEKCLVTAGNADVQCENVVFNQLSAVGGISVMNIGTDGGFFNVKSVATCNKCIVVSGNKNKISAIVENSSIPVVDNGLQNNIEIFGVSNKEFYSGNTEKEVGGNYSKHVAGTYTKEIVGDANDSVDGNRSSIVSGVTTETYNSDKNVNGTNESKTLSGKKVVNAGSLEENAGTSTFAVDGNSTESVGGNKSEIITGVTNETYKNTKITNLTTEEKNADNITYNVKNKYDLTTKEFKLNADNAIVNLKEHLFNLIFDDKKINLYNTLYDFVNIKDYGAVGDGVTDDTFAFKSAMNAGNVFIPSGRYIITELSGARTVLSNGEIVSDLTLTDFDGELIGGKYKSLNILNCSCKLTNLNVVNTSNALTATNSKIVLSNSYFKGGGNCVLLTNCLYSIIENIFVEAVKITGEETRLHCVQLETCTNCKITNSFALNANWFGFSVYNSFKCAINNCISYNSYAEGINFENTNSSIMSDNIVSWDDGISNDYGISLFGNNDNSANLNIVSGNLIYNCKQSGIAVDGNAHSNNVYGNNLINCNSQSSIRNAAITSGKLDGHTGQPGGNYIHDNLVIPSSNTTGLYNEIEALSKNYINNNFSTIPLNIGNYGLSIIGSNIGIDTIAFNSTSNNGNISDSFIVGITPTVFMISATLNVTEIKDTQISIPYNTNSLVFGCAFDALHNVTIQVFGHDNVINFTPINTGIHYIRAIVSLNNR